MKLSEMEQKSEQLNSIRNQLEIKEADLQKFVAEEAKAREDFQVQKILAEIKGEPCEEEFKLEQLDKTKTEIETLQKSISNQEKEIFEGMKQLVFDALPRDIPPPDSEKKVVVNFEKGSFTNAVKFMASILNSDIPLKLDNILLYPDKITVANVQQKIEAAEALKNFIENVKRMARIALRENDPDIEETAKYLYESPYRDIWETIRGRKTVSLHEIYSELNIKQDEMQKVRNFFTNTKIVLREKYPFICVEKGNYELSFFGSLVWKYYQSNYIRKTEVEQEDKNEKEATIKESAKKDDSQKNERTTLNSFLDDKKIKETLYGGKV